jgi:hypothetical protein
VVTLPLWQLVTLGVTLLLAWFGFVFAVWKIVSHLQERQTATYMATIARDAAEAKQRAEATEKGLLSLLAKLPLEYVRREDWIRNQTVIEAKLDALAAKLEKKGGRYDC